MLQFGRRKYLTAPSNSGVGRSLHAQRQAKTLDTTLALAAGPQPSSFTVHGDTKFRNSVGAVTEQGEEGAGVIAEGQLRLRLGRKKRDYQIAGEGQTTVDSQGSSSQRIRRLLLSAFSRA